MILILHTYTHKKRTALLTVHGQRRWNRCSSLVLACSYSDVVTTTLTYTHTHTRLSHAEKNSPGLTHSDACRGKRWARHDDLGFPWLRSQVLRKMLIIHTAAHTSCTPISSRWGRGREQEGAWSWVRKPEAPPTFTAIPSPFCLFFFSLAGSIIIYYPSFLIVRLPVGFLLLSLSHTHTILLFLWRPSNKITNAAYLFMRCCTIASITNRK